MQSTTTLTASFPLRPYQKLPRNAPERSSSTGSLRYTSPGLAWLGQSIELGNPPDLLTDCPNRLSRADVDFVPASIDPVPAPRPAPARSAGLDLFCSTQTKFRIDRGSARLAPIRYRKSDLPADQPS